MHAARQAQDIFPHKPMMAETRELMDITVKALQDALEAGLQSGEPRPFDSEAFLRRMHAEHG